MNIFDNKKKLGDWYSALILHYIEGWVRTHMKKNNVQSDGHYYSGYMTHEEICEATDISRTTVKNRLKFLTKEGILLVGNFATYNGNKKRSYRIDYDRLKEYEKKGSRDDLRKGRTTTHDRVSTRPLLGSSDDQPITIVSTIPSTKIEPIQEYASNAGQEIDLKPLIQEYIAYGELVFDTWKSQLKKWKVRKPVSQPDKNRFRGLLQLEENNFKIEEYVN